MKFIDLFSGIGGFHLAVSAAGLRCVWACEIDEEAAKSYHANFVVRPEGDIRKVRPTEIPDHDLLCAGFPCQPFSIIGSREGVRDTKGRGMLFHEIVRIAACKRPQAMLLENVKQFATIQKGAVLRNAIQALEGLGYDTDWRILDARDFGLPQKRERILIVALMEGLMQNFKWPSRKVPMRSLSALLEVNPDPIHFASEYIRKKRCRTHRTRLRPAIWHENKGGNVSSHPYSCALRAGASYNYLLVNGERRLTPRECLRLQGFPDRFRIVCNDSQTRKQAGNAVPVPMIHAVTKEIVNAITNAPKSTNKKGSQTQRKTMGTWKVA